MLAKYHTPQLPRSPPLGRLERHLKSTPREPPPSPSLLLSPLEGLAGSPGGPLGRKRRGASRSLARSRGRRSRACWSRRPWQRRHWTAVPVPQRPDPTLPRTDLWRAALQRPVPWRSQRCRFQSSVRRGDRPARGRASLRLAARDNGHPRLRAAPVGDNSVRPPRRQHVATSPPATRCCGA